MSDINKLLKRAAVFEKLALYSNRTDYLKSLANEMLVPENEEFVSGGLGSNMEPTPSIPSNSLPAAGDYNTIPKDIINLYNQYKSQIQNALKTKNQNVLAQLKNPFKGVVNKLSKLENPYEDARVQNQLAKYVQEGNALIKAIEQEFNKTMFGHENENVQWDK